MHQQWNLRQDRHPIHLLELLHTRPIHLMELLHTQPVHLHHTQWQLVELHLITRQVDDLPIPPMVCLHPLRMDQRHIQPPVNPLERHGIQVVFVERTVIPCVQLDWGYDILYLFFVPIV